MFLLLAAIAAAMFVLEKLFPANVLPTVRGWWLRIALVNLAQFGVVILAGLTWDRYFEAFALLSIESYFGKWGGGLIAYLFSTLVYYGWHRIRHESEFFWRLCHQIHHSPRRLEVLVSFYKHPVEIVINSILSAVIVYLLFGLSLEGAAIYTALTAVAEYFYHWNVKTPRWIGWLVQRPESHRVHHQFEHHSQNYADLPVWDWIFGTLKNPQKAPPRCGFSEDREARFEEMLAFRDVHKQPAISPTCFGCRKRWACEGSRANRESGEGS